MASPTAAAREAAVNEVGKLLRNALVHDYTFALVVFGEGDVNWISNADKGDLLVAMKEMIARMEGRVTPQTGHA